MASHDRPLSRYLCESGARDGKARFLRSAGRDSGTAGGLCARGVEVDDVRWQDSARIVHADLPQVSRGMEDCARSHFGGGVEAGFWRVASGCSFYFFTRTCTGVPSGSLPVVNSTTPLRIIPSSSLPASALADKSVCPT